MNNAAWEDRRLSIESKAVLAFFHSRPAAEIKVMEARETLRVGADKMKRITRELLAAGYMARTDRRFGARSYYTLVDFSDVRRVTE